MATEAEQREEIKLHIESPSYLNSTGNCPHCGKPIDIQYEIVFDHLIKKRILRLGQSGEIITKKGEEKKDE